MLHEYRQADRRAVGFYRPLMNERDYVKGWQIWPDACTRTTTARGRAWKPCIQEIVQYWTPPMSLLEISCVGVYFSRVLSEDGWMRLEINQAWKRGLHRHIHESLWPVWLDWTQVFLELQDWLYARNTQVIDGEMFRMENSVWLGQQRIYLNKRIVVALHLPALLVCYICFQILSNYLPYLLHIK